MSDSSVKTALLGLNRRITVIFVGIGIALGVFFGVALGLVETSLFDPLWKFIQSTEGWVLWLLFVGVPAVVAYKNDGLAGCWLFNYGVLLPVFLMWAPGDEARYSYTFVQRVVNPLYLAILFGSLAFFLGIGARWVVRTLYSDTPTDMDGVVTLLLGENRHRTVATSLAGLALGAGVVLAFGLDVPLLGRGPTAPEHQTLHWLLIGIVFISTAAAAYVNDGLIPAWLLAVGFLGVVYSASFLESYGIGQAVISGFLSGLTFGAVGFLLGFGARWIVTTRRMSLVERKPST